MGVSVASEEALNQLAKRYPSLSFLLSIDKGGDEELEAPFDELARLPSATSLKAIEVLYIYGLGLGRAYTHFSDWLEANPKRHLVFIEEHLAVLRRFLTTPWAALLLSNPCVHIRIPLDPQQLRSFAADCAADFPFEHIEVIALNKKANSDRFYRLRSDLFCLTTVEHALLIEGLHYHLLSRNFFPNYFRLSQASSGNALKGRFRGIPAIICGAGPSLEDEIEQLRKLDNRALVIACGSAITALSQRGVVPHLAIAIDPNFEEYNRFRSSSAFEVPLFYVNRVHPRIFATCNGPLGYLHTLVGGTAEIWMEKQLGMSCPPLETTFDLEAMSVTTTAIEFAYAMGCDPIILVGVDLAFTNQLSYANKVIDHPAFNPIERERETRVSEKLLRRKDRRGEPIDTLIKWVMEAGAISRFAARYDLVEWINATAGGLGFEKIPYRPLGEIPLQESFDLRGRLAAAMEELCLPITQEEVAKALKELHKSLNQASEQCQIARRELDRVKGENKDPETGRLIVAKLDLEELEAYTSLLKVADLTLERMAKRHPLIDAHPSSKEEPFALKHRSLEELFSCLTHLISFYSEQIDIVLEDKIMRKN